MSDVSMSDSSEQPAFTELPSVLPTGDGAAVQLGGVMVEITHAEAPVFAAIGDALTAAESAQRLHLSGQVTAFIIQRIMNGPWQPGVSISVFENDLSLAENTGTVINVDVHDDRVTVRSRLTDDDSIYEYTVDEIVG